MIKKLTPAIDQIYENTFIHGLRPQIFYSRGRYNDHRAFVNLIKAFFGFKFKFSRQTFLCISFFIFKNQRLLEQPDHRSFKDHLLHQHVQGHQHVAGPLLHSRSGSRCHSFEFIEGLKYVNGVIIDFQNAPVKI
jgi:hypothetical protein